MESQELTVDGCVRRLELADDDDSSDEGGWGEDDAAPTLKELPKLPQVEEAERAPWQRSGRPPAVCTPLMSVGNTASVCSRAAVELFACCPDSPPNVAAPLCNAGRSITSSMLEGVSWIVCSSCSVVFSLGADRCSVGQHFH